MANSASLLLCKNMSHGAPRDVSCGVVSAILYDSLAEIKPISVGPSMYGTTYGSVCHHTQIGNVSVLLFRSVLGGSSFCMRIII